MKKKILIVDDERHIVRHLSKRLRAKSYEVIVAYDGIQCLKKASNIIPDLILLDMKMPHLSGIEVFEELKGIKTTKDIPVIFMVANPKWQMKNILMGMGAKGFITKPFFSENLELTIEMALNKYNSNENKQYYHSQKNTNAI